MKMREGITNSATLVVEWTKKFIPALVVLLAYIASQSVINPDKKKDDPVPDVPDAKKPLTMLDSVDAPIGRGRKVTARAIGPISWIIPPEARDYADVYECTDYVIVVPFAEGKFSIGAETTWRPKESDKDEKFGPRWTSVKSGKGPIPPPDDPNKPKPKPDDPKPKPDDPAKVSPFPDEKFRALVIFDKDGLAKLKKEQLTALYSDSVEVYLDSHCALGADGKTPEWRKLDKKTPMDYADKLWVDLMARKVDSYPWLIVGKKSSFFEGKYPDDEKSTVELLKKVGG